MAPFARPAGPTRCRSAPVRRTRPRRANWPRRPIDMKRQRVAQFQYKNDLGLVGGSVMLRSKPGKRWPALRRVRTVLIIALGLSLSSLVPGLTGIASAASPLNVFVGYFDTHTVPFSSNQPNPWPYKDPSSFVGTPCPNYPNDTTCWDASALRLDNPGSTDVTGVSASVVIGTKTYALWGSNLTVKARRDAGAHRDRPLAKLREFRRIRLSAQLL